MRRARDRRARPARRSPRWPTRARATTCRWTSCDTYMESMRIDCGPVRIDVVGGADRLHERQRRGRRADHGPAAGRAARPATASPAWAWPSSSPTSSATCARTSRSTGSTCRAMDGERDRRRPRHRSGFRRAAGRCRCGARASCSARARPALAAVEPRVRPGHADGARACTCACSTASSAWATTCSAAAPGLPPWQLGAAALRLAAGARVTIRATLRGADAHRDRRPRGRRADLRRQLRRAGRGARAGRLRRRRAGGGPLRDRRAPDLGLRGARPRGCTRWAWRARSARRSRT